MTKNKTFNFSISVELVESFEDDVDTIARCYYPDEPHGPAILVKKGLNTATIEHAVKHELGHIIDWCVSNGQSESLDNRESNADSIALSLTGEATGCTGCWKGWEMTDEIIKQARECGGIADDQTIVLYHEELERFAAIVAAKEREACAKVAAGYDATPWKHCQTSTHAADMVSASIAAAIRERSAICVNAIMSLDTESTNLCQSSTKLVETPKLHRAGSFGGD